MKYATAMSPARMNATGRVNKPSTISTPPTSATRWEGLPDIPTLSDFVPGFEATSWYGVGAPRNTPIEIIEKLNKEIKAALAEPNVKARLVALGGTVLAGSPADFAKLIAEEIEKWGKVIKFAGIKPE